MSRAGRNRAERRLVAIRGAGLRPAALGAELDAASRAFVPAAIPPDGLAAVRTAAGKLLAPTPVQEEP